MVIDVSVLLADPEHHSSQILVLPQDPCMCDVSKCDIPT